MVTQQHKQCSCNEPRVALHGRLADHPPGTNRRLVAFLTDRGDGVSVHQQMKVIAEYCAEHDMNVVEQVIYSGGSQSTLQQSLIETRRLLDKADGIIVSDLNRLTEHQERGYELRPLLHEFFCGDCHKRLISVAEGIDTRTASGQLAAIEIVNQVKDPDSHEDWVPDTQKTIRGY